MVFGAENSGLFGTSANFSCTIYLQGPVVSIISRSILWEAAEILLLYSMIRFLAHHQHYNEFIKFKDLAPQILMLKATNVKASQ
jgi:hypothetical protein